MTSKSERIRADTDEYLIVRPATPIMIVKGRGTVVEDLEGIQYLDCNAGPGVLAAGHAHPEITAAIHEQAEGLTQGPGMCYTEPLFRLAKKLAEISPGDLKRSFFCNSGAEANEGAVKLAMRFNVKQGRSAPVTISLQHSFHGRLALTTALSGASSGRRGLGMYSLFPGIAHIPAPYCYRCPFQLRHGDCGARCAEALEQQIRDYAPGDVGVLILEPILGVAGVLVPPSEYLPRIEAICRNHGVTLILDEVFCGLGRTGKLFCHEHWQVQPDIVTVGKALGGGFPLAAFIARDVIGQSFDPGDHYTTFGWNNVFTLSISLKALEVIEREGLVENAAFMGQRLKNGLSELARASAIIGEVRGLGLFIGVEIVRGAMTTDPSPELARALATQLREEEHLLAGVVGTYKNVIRLTPPLCVSANEIDEILARFSRALLSVEASSGGSA